MTTGISLCYGDRCSAHGIMEIMMESVIGKNEVMMIDSIVVADMASKRCSDGSGNEFRNDNA